MTPDSGVSAKISSLRYQPIALAAVLGAVAGLAGAQGLASAPGARIAASAAAPAAAGGPSWGSLSATQRTTLAPLARDWATLDAARKSKWLEVAARFPSMPASDQQRVQERMAEWARMTPTERGRARLSFQESKQFSPEQKQAHWEAYKALPDDERRALADRQRPGDEAARKPVAGAAVANQPKAAGAPVAGLSTPLTKPVAPTLVQAKPGATTTLMTIPVEPPAHHRPGQPKIAAKAGQVDRTTLLPQSGPQAAASTPQLP